MWAKVSISPPSERSSGKGGACGLDIADIRRGDFPLPTLGRVLDRLRAEVLDGGRARSASSFCARG
jgi:hypothetical protein